MTLERSAALSARQRTPAGIDYAAADCRRLSRRDATLSGDVDQVRIDRRGPN